MYYELSKREKKIARQCIDKGLDIAYANALNETGIVVQDWYKEKLSTRDAYMKLFKVIKEHDYAIARRYNNLGGSRWLETVAQLYAEEIITEDDIRDFSEETRKVIDLFSS
ncbi:MAG: hypothetical protein JST21_12910 [Bacteroidetes bacterium]|nr:hypothetical protein [Bacteroidota bacterium]